MDLFTTIVDHLVTLAGIIGVLGLAHFAWVISGVGNMVVKSSLKNWSWKRFRKDLLKLACFAISMTVSSIVSDVLGFYIDTLQIAQLSAFMDTVSWGVIVVIPLVAALYLLYRALKNNKSLVDYEKAANLIGIDPDAVLSVADNSHEIAETIYEFFDVPKELAKKHAEFEKEYQEEGGLGAAFSLPINSYDAFRAAVLGKGFDTDGAYGAQCWDGANLLWQQLGRFLSTGGTGAAKGCWTAAKGTNSGGDIELVYDKNSVKRGDVVVFSAGTYGHIGYADTDYNGGSYIPLLGQNQGGTSYPGGGSNFNVVNISMASFLGAFRYKKWANSSAPAPAPSTSTISKSGIQLGDVVTLQNWVDYSGTPLRKTQEYYTVSGINGDRVVLNSGSTVYAAVNINNLRELEPDDVAPAETPKESTPTPPTPTETFKVGDVVVPIEKVDYDGRKLRQYDDNYTITSLSGDRAVLSARGAVWAAMSTSNIRKA